MISIYTINLKKNTERRERILQQAASVGVRIDFIDAVVGVDLDEKYIDSLSEKSSCFIGRTLSKGEIGCYLSHVKAIKKFLLSNDDFAIITEDDIIFNDSFTSFHKKMSELRAHNIFFDVILLGYRNGYGSFWGRSKISEYELLRFSDNGYGAHAYLISRNGALKIIAEASEPIWPFDYVTGGKALELLKVYGLVNKIVDLDEFTSNLSSLESERNTLGIISTTNNKKHFFYKNIKKIFKQIIPIRHYK
ncbi:TPA: glycosyltransferase family 25 protein [Photobacterium damselae]